MANGQGLDYAALAKASGALYSRPAPQAQQAPQPSGPASLPAGIDYAALAKQAGAVDSQPAPQPSATPGAGKITGISAQPPPAGWRDSVARWADNVMNDIKHGTDVTGIGTVLKKMGAHGVYSGNSQAAGDFMASLPLGLLQATKGAAEITQPGKTWQGTKDIAGGAAQAATIPAAFMGGRAVEGGAGAAAAASGKLFGNVERAGQLFNEVKAAAGSQPVPITEEVSQAASRIMELSERGARGMPRVISRFVSRVTDPEKAHITYDEARDFYSNVSRLSANEYGNMSPQMKAAVGRFAGAFKDAIRAAADTVGKGDMLDEAMQLYARAKSWQQFGANTWQFIKQSAPIAAGVGVGVRRAAKSILDYF